MSVNKKKLCIRFILIDNRGFYTIKLKIVSLKKNKWKTTTSYAY